MDAQLKKGLLEIGILTALLPGDSYGYQIIKDVSGVVAISESTLYPILRRLESATCLTVYTQEHSGRLRKYYHLTDMGREKIREFLDEWDQMTAIHHFIEEGYGREQG
ncbi:MAG: PadR family transcriptional regulator [Clostridia bacterium]